jgi:hypothetical protein
MAPWIWFLIIGAPKPDLDAFLHPPDSHVRGTRDSSTSIRPLATTKCRAIRGMEARTPANVYYQREARTSREEQRKSRLVGCTGRIGEAATPRHRDRAKGPRYRRGTRCCRQGRHDQADCPAPSPREARMVALGPPSDRDRKAWYFQRYVEHLPVAGEIVLFNRSWYNRAGVERVMEFCSKEEYDTFLKTAPIFEELLVHCGITLVKYYLDIRRRRKRRAQTAGR